MRRFVVAGLIALAAGSGVVAVALADAPHARLTSYVCQTALDPASRAISITAVMRPVTGTEKMAMRFQLLKRTKRWSRPVPLTGTDLNAWLIPKNPTLGSRPGDRWVVKHPVVDLAGPDFYRFRVSFRWIDATGHVIGKATRSSAMCFQPERRPDLEVAQIQVAPAPQHPGQDLYVATIRNVGKTTSEPFTVQFSDGSSLTSPPKSEGPLRAHQARNVRFLEPPCSASAPATITVYPQNPVDDANPSNNSAMTTCPSTGQSLEPSNQPLRRSHQPLEP
jgi:hypothetical protein